ncbi:putative HAT dimerization domain, ribonuclease H-like superfamily, hAT-like transposase, RNase-H [Arabidopsis thaliana]
MQVWKIQNWLTVNEYSQDEVIRNMMVLMKERFDKYWAEVSDIFAIATVFDPRLKLTLAEYCFAKLDISTREKRMKHLRAQLRKLFEVYENMSNAVSPTTESREDVTHDDEAAKGNFSNYDLTLDMYLDEPAMNVRGFESLDILYYWKDNGPRFGKLASMACDILSIPITTVASKSSFSIGTRVLSKYRSRLLLRNVQALICSRNWLKGFESYENGK